MTIHFHDVSSYQGDYHPTGPTIAKATEGTGFTDPRFATTRQRTIAGGWPFLGYHFLRSGQIAQQVAHAAAVVGKGQPLMLDVETANDGSFPSFAEVLQFVAGWPGIVSLAYIPQWFWAGKWHSPSLAPLASRGVGLISSAYTAYSDTGPGWHPYGGMTPVIWQHTSTPIDTNAYKGTQAQLGAVFAGKPAQIAPPEEEPVSFMVVKDKATGKVYSADGVHLYEVPPAAVGDAAYVAAHEDKYATGTPVEVDNLSAFGSLVTPTVDADAVAAALAANKDFVAAIAKAVNDDAAARLAE